MARRKRYPTDALISLRVLSHAYAFAGGDGCWIGVGEVAIRGLILAQDEGGNASTNEAAHCHGVHIHDMLG